MGEKFIDVFKYYDIQIEEKYVSFYRHLRSEHPKFAPPCFNPWISWKFHYVHIRIYATSIICQAMERVWNCGVPCRHTFKHIDIVGRILVTPLNANYVICIHPLVLPFVYISNRHCRDCIDNHIL